MSLYTYKAIVVDVYDGDTISVDIDLGLHVHMRGIKVRLARIDAPEMRGEERPEGIKARDWLRQEILHHAITLRTIKDRTGLYGRYIGEIWKDGVNINDALVKKGLAVSQ